MRIKYFFLALCTAFLLIVFPGGPLSAQELEIQSHDLVQSSRVTRTVSEFTYSIQLQNSGADYQNVRATVTSNSPHTMVVAGELAFGDMASGDTVTSQDLLTIRHNRRYPFSWEENISWEFSHDPIVGDSFRVGPEGGAFNDLDGTSVVVPPGALTEDRLISVETYGDGASQFVSGPYLAGARFGPAGLTFDTPITVTFSLSETVPEGAELVLLSYDQDQSAWSMTEFAAIVNPGGQSATAEISHFSDYFVMELGMSVAVARFKNSYFDPCNYRPEAEIFSELQQEVFEMFPVGYERTWSNFWIENPVYGYNCYSINGLRVALRGERLTFDNNGPIVLDRTERENSIGSTAEYFMFHLIDDEQRQSSSYSCGDFTISYNLDIFIYWMPGGGSATLEADYEEPLCLGQDAEVRARLTCGEEPYPDVWVEFSSGLGSFTPDGLFTNQEGLTSWTTYTPHDEGTDDLLGQFDALANVYTGTGIENSENLPIVVDACPYVEVTPSSTDLFVDNSETFTAILRRGDDEEMPGQDFDWSASNARISLGNVTPNSAVATGVAPGDVTLTASATLDSNEVVTGDAAIEVLPLDMRLEIDPPVACLVPGETVEFSAEVFDVNDEPQVVPDLGWSSSDDNVVLVDPVTGVATAVGTGEATITVTATTSEGAELVEFIDVSSGYLGVEPRVYETGVDGGFQLQVTAYDEEEPDTPLLRAGPFVEVCEFGTCIYLVDLPYADPNFFPAQVEADNLLYSDPNASYRLFSWFSNNENVATVDDYGHVHGVSEGQAVITAVALPGSDVERMTCAVVNVVNKQALKSWIEFEDEVQSCQYDDQGQPMTGSVIHPFDLSFDWTGPVAYGGTNLFNLRTGLPVVILPSGTNISLIDDPAAWFDPFPPAQEYWLQPGFKILVWNWDSMTFRTCGGHRYAGFQHVGYEWRAEYQLDIPVFEFFLFDDYLDTPAGWHLIGIPPEECDEEACGVGAVSGSVAPEPYPNWWLDFEWLWEYVVPEDQGTVP